MNDKKIKNEQTPVNFKLKSTLGNKKTRNIKKGWIKIIIIKKDK